MIEIFLPMIALLQNRRRIFVIIWCTLLLLHLWSFSIEAVHVFFTGFSEMPISSCLCEGIWRGLVPTLSVTHISRLEVFTVVYVQIVSITLSRVTKHASYFVMSNAKRHWKSPNHTAISIITACLRHKGFPMWTRSDGHLIFAEEHRSSNSKGKCTSASVNVVLWSRSWMPPAFT